MNARRHFRRLRQIKPARLITDLSNPLEALDNKEFALRFRFDKDTFLILFRLLEVDLMKGSNRGLPVPPIHCLLLTLRFWQRERFSWFKVIYLEFRNQQ